MSDPKSFHSYLLRLWCNGESLHDWHALLVDSQTGERISFATLEQLFVFLLEAVTRAGTQTRNSLDSNLADDQHRP